MIGTPFKLKEAAPQQAANNIESPGDQSDGHH